MAPTKVKAGASKGANKRNTKPSSSGSTSKNKSKSSTHRVRNPQKTKSVATPQKKKRREYTEKELDIPKLNMITPAGVQQPRGKKKGKVFVDDEESMRTILAMVNADKEGQIESKMMKARQMEEIRQARQKEMEKRQELKKEKLEETKNSLKRQKRKKPSLDDDEPETTSRDAASSKKSKKRVSFA